MDKNKQIEQLRLKKGTVRDDGLVFWKYDKTCPNGEWWTSRERYERMTNKPKTIGFQKTMDSDKRFWGKVEKTSTCWNWKGSISSSGYGTISVSGKQVSAHHYLLPRTLKKGEFACHSCDNRACVNPDHLVIADHEKNMIDMCAKARFPLSKLRKEDVDFIRNNYKFRDSRLGGKQLAKRFNVKNTTISSIINRHSWKHVEKGRFFHPCDKTEEEVEE